MSRPTVTVISAKGESTKDTVTVPNVFKVSRTTSAIRDLEGTSSTSRQHDTYLRGGWRQRRIRRWQLQSRNWALLTPHTGTYPPGHRPRSPHWHEQEPTPAIRCVSLSRPHNYFSNTTIAPRRLVTKPLPSHGVLVAPSPVFPVSLVEELTVPVRLPLVTCAAPVACLLPPRSGASGTRRST